LQTAIIYLIYYVAKGDIISVNLVQMLFILSFGTYVVQIYNK